MYEDRDYQGPSEAFEPGTHVATTTSFTAIGNDAITSMIVAPGKNARICKESNGTNCRTYTGHVPYVGDDFDNGTSYIFVY